MKAWSPERVGRAAHARLVAAGAPDEGPRRAVIDSRDVGPGDLFVGLPGAHVDGSRFAAGALAAGAWGVLVSEAHAEALEDAPGVVLAAEAPLAALQALAHAWRHALAVPVVGITGSVGKTSTKDLLAAMLRQELAVTASAQNRNTEIGVPLTILEAPEGTEALVLEMGMRGAGQLKELTDIARHDIGVVTAIAPVHLEQLGSIEAIAAEKATLVRELGPDGTAVLPADEPLLDPHRRDDIPVVTFGPGGDVDEAVLDLAVELPFTSAHMRRNACAALAAARVLGTAPTGRVEVALSASRGQRLTRGDGVVVVDDCYNANPMSMRAALDDLAATAPGRRVAVLGDMRELGPDAAAYHAEVGRHARDRGVGLLVAVGELSAAYPADHHVGSAAEAAALVPGLVRPGDTVLVKASRGIGLEAVVAALRADAPGTAAGG